MTITATLPTTTLYPDSRPQPMTRQRSDDVAALPATLTRVQDAFAFAGYVVLAMAIGTALLNRNDAN